jgi:pseudouridine synthase
LTHPKFEIEKEYEVVVDGYLKPSEKQQIESGIETKEISTSKSKILINKQSGNKTDLNIIIHEGKKREIRRIFSVFGYEVIYLKRIRVGKLTLGNIKTGLWRELSSFEISLLTK